jgi:hypothetical protein
MAMTMNVQEIQAMLWTVRKRVSGIRYRGTGMAIDVMAIKETVIGNPRDWGHL